MKSHARVAAAWATHAVRTCPEGRAVRRLHVFDEGFKRRVVAEASSKFVELSHERRT